MNTELSNRQDYLSSLTAK